MDQTASLIGSKIGNYIVVDVLGQGAMGVVLYAQDEETKGEAAIKLLAPELATDDVSKERMAREAKALFSLKHPNIVSTYDFGSLDNGRAFLVMEYVSGENLDDYLFKNSTLPVDIVINMAMQLANAMQFAHDSGIIHRDLKPQNIMLDQKKGALTVKILDFGIAKMTDDRRKLTRTGEVVGSPIFMSPEQCQGKKFDQRSDIYSLGIVLFKCITGKYPHHGSTLRDTFLMKTTRDCPKIEEFVPDYKGPQRLAKLIYKCLEIKPRHRFASMADVYMELRIIADESNIVVDSRQSLKESGVHFQTKALARLKEEPSPAAQSVRFNQSRKIGNRGSADQSSGIGKLLTLIVILFISLSVVAFAGYYYLNKADVDIGKVDSGSSATNKESDVKNALNRDRKTQSTKAKPTKKNSLFKTIENPGKTDVEVKTAPSEEPSINEEPARQVRKSPPRQKVQSRGSSNSKSQIKNKRQRKIYSPSKNEQHDAWWKYRLKKEN